MSINKAKAIGLRATDTHMGLFDFTVRCVIGEQETAHLVNNILENCTNG